MWPLLDNIQGRKPPTLVTSVMLFWADQDRLINLLESRLEKGSQQEKRMMSELVKERQKLCEMTAQWEKLKASRKKAIKITKKKCLYSILSRGWLTTSPR